MTLRRGDDTTIPEDGRLDSRAPAPEPAEHWALALCWSRTEPWRVGQVLFVQPDPSVITWVGRGEGTAEGPEKAAFGEQRPGSWRPFPALVSQSLSRYQLSLRVRGGECIVKNDGKAALFRNGHETSESSVEQGDVLQVGNQLLCLVCRRPMELARAIDYPEFSFGAADPHGLVGESPAIWDLRRTILQVAARPDHVLLTGESGAGKDLVARAIHGSSDLPPSRLVIRNAATLPSALIDAELFGNTKNYPNPGMADRPGLIGEANGGTLFLDEFAELPVELHTHLLSVLDRGEYQRLGEASTRASSFRLIAATNRALSALKPDLLARLPFRVAVPGLNARREDIPLLVRHFLRRVAARGDAAALELFPDRDPRLEPEVPVSWIAALLRHDYRTNVRELEALLWEALLAPRRELPASGTLASPSVASAEGPPPHEQPASNARTAHAIQECLDANNGSLELTWRALGLSNRFALMRLIKKHGLEVRRRHS